MTRLLIGLAIVLSATLAQAVPIAESTMGKVTVRLYDEPCALKDRIKNLEYRAVWLEGGKEFRGCFGMNQMGIVLIYFEDKTVVGVPAQVFHKLQDL